MSKAFWQLHAYIYNCFMGVVIRILEYGSEIKLFLISGLK